MDFFIIKIGFCFFRFNFKGEFEVFDIVKRLYFLVYIEIQAVWCFNSKKFEIYCQFVDSESLYMI
jgi:hypothetical protein